MKFAKTLTPAGFVFIVALLCSSSPKPAKAQANAPSQSDETIAVTAPVAVRSATKQTEPVDSTTLAIEAVTPTLDQTKQQLRERANFMRAVAKQRRQEIERRAIAIGAPLFVPGTQGTGVKSLSDVTDEGEPIYVTPDNITAAATSGATKLWPTNAIAALPITTGQSGLNLSGSNQLIGLWEADYFVGSAFVQTNHDQFALPGGASRAIQVDADVSPSPGISPHATAVAGTLASSGNNTFFSGINFGNWSKGSAYRANLHAYSFSSGLGDNFSMEAANGLRLANNSYGQQAGWAFDGVDWIWFGLASTSAPEDWKFGAYLGSLLGEASSYSLDSDAVAAPNGLLIFSAGNLANIGPGHAVTYYLSTDPSKTSPQTAARDWSNGDDGGYDSLPPSACAKNVLSVGAVYTITPAYSNASDVLLASFSSFGPTDDGRIKPEVVAAGIRPTNTTVYNPYGFGGLVSTWWDPAIPTWTSNYVIGIQGTSFSAPTVASGLALLLERRHQIRPEWENNDYPIRSSTLRALAVHTTDPATTNNGPSFKFGYGLFDAASAVNLMAADAITGGAGGAKPYVKDTILPSSEVIQFKVHATNSTVPLKVTLAWTDPVPLSGQTQNSVDQTTKRLVNDLDLRVYPPGVTNNFNPNAAGTFKPWILNADLTNKTAAARSAAATTGDDSINNIEQVVVFAPSTNAGDYYTVRVTYKGSLNGGQQWASLITSGNAVPIVDFRITSFTELMDGSFAITWNSVVGGVYYVQTSSDLFTWTDVGGPYVANLESMSKIVTPPGPYSFYRIKRVY
jgi:hypothetical protein